MKRGGGVLAGAAGEEIGDLIMDGQKPRFCCNIWRWPRVIHKRNEVASQAATSNSAVMNLAWPLMSLPLMFRTCPFLIIAIAS
jgi:hypothetical protein